MNFFPSQSAPASCEELVSPPILDVFRFFSMRIGDGIPPPEKLNEAAVAFYGEKWCGPMFVAQRHFDSSESRYYEEIISQDNLVPTRENNWHDLFNAFIWMQFPATKKYLNDLHMKDITQYGLHPRTSARNRITHFDECGVLLVVRESSLVNTNQLLFSLATHDWHDAFLAKKGLWYEDVLPIVFGHANLEMLLSPFIGLTGKWLALSVPDKVYNNRHLEDIDKLLVQRIKSLGDFQTAAVLKPLPLLGVPGWHNNQNKNFYDNTEYFRPLRNKASVCVQLPLRSHHNDKPE